MPPALGSVTEQGTPVNALLVSSLGLGAAVLVRAFWPDSAYVWFFGVALFGALFVWLMIFVTHIAFCSAALKVARIRGARDGGGAIAPKLEQRWSEGGPLGSYAGAALVAAILASTWWVLGLRSTLVAGGPWLLLLAIGYRLSAARARP